MNPQVVSVKEFVSILNETLGFAYPLVVVEGEVGSFKVNQGKWVFFDLKDDEATLSCFMPIYQLKVVLEDGMRVRVSGSPKLTKWGKFSFTAKSVELAGEGELRRAFELLKGRLEAEGLFDPSRKRAIPALPSSIGLITSSQSAAYSDFIEILSQRWRGIVVRVADVQVQGAPAPDQIVGAIDYFNQLAHPVDVLVLIRGGGSLEDLQAFNTEMVTRAVAASRTPTIVGVGHEIDVSLSDYAADVRAATPTDAARLVVPDRSHVMQTIEFRCNALERNMSTRLVATEHRLARSAQLMERYLLSPLERVMRLEMMLRRDLTRMEVSVAQQQRQLASLTRSVISRQGSVSALAAQTLATLRRVLSSFDPKATLARGYAIVAHKGVILHSSRAVSVGDSLVIQLADGRLNSRVIDEK